MARWRDGGNGRKWEEGGGVLTEVPVAVVLPVAAAPLAAQLWGRCRMRLALVAGVLPAACGCNHRALAAHTAALSECGQLERTGVWLLLLLLLLVCVCVAWGCPQCVRPAGPPFVPRPAGPPRYAGRQPNDVCDFVGATCNSTSCPLSPQLSSVTSHLSVTPGQSPLSHPDGLPRGHVAAVQGIRV